MKKSRFFCALTALTFGLSLCACSANVNTSDAKQSDRLSIVTSNFPAYDFAKNVAGDAADVTMLLPPGAESHSFEPTPQNIIEIKECDVFIYNGGESESWIDDILESATGSDQKRIAMIDCVNVLEEEITEGMQAEQGEDEPEYDEHVWTSPLNAQKIVTSISQTLSQADSDNAELYAANADAYNEQLSELDASLREITGSGVRKTIVFGDRMPFRYLAEEYGLDTFAAFPGCASETEASASTIAFLIDKVRDDGIPVVFHLELSNEKLADTICADTGAKSLLLHSCHNVTKDDFDSGVTYVELMKRNAENLKEALS